MNLAKIKRRVTAMSRMASSIGYPSQILKLVQMAPIWGNYHVDLRIRALEKNRFALRPGTSDLKVLFDVLGHVYDEHPPIDRVRRVWDLGANIGLTTAAYAVGFPHARVTGVELDANNAEFAKRNVSAFGARCNIITGAVWISDGEISYSILRGSEHSARVSAEPVGIRATAWSLNTLLKEDKRVDFLKMDIEGAEQRVLRENTEWSSRVQFIYVEWHGTYGSDSVCRDLKRLGFRPTISARHPFAVFGARPE
jgi:FkbM family methyltransferase